MITAILLSGLVFKEYEENYNVAIKELERLVKTFFDKILMSLKYTCE